MSLNGYFPENMQFKKLKHHMKAVGSSNQKIKDHLLNVDMLLFTGGIQKTTGH